MELTKEELLILRKMIADYTRTKDEENAMLDAIAKEKILQVELDKVSKTYKKLLKDATEEERASLIEEMTLVARNKEAEVLSKLTDDV